MKRPWLAAVLSMLLFTVAGAALDPFVRLVCWKYYIEYFRRTHLRFRQVDPCRFEVLDDIPQDKGVVWLWQSGTSRGLFESGFPWTPPEVQYDSGSRMLEAVDCNPDGGRAPVPPYDVTFEHDPDSRLRTSEPPLLPDDDLFKTFMY